MSSRLHTALIRLLDEFGVRGVVNAVAELLEQEGEQGNKLPYDTGVDKGETVSPGDLQTAANALRADLW